MLGLHAVLAWIGIRGFLWFVLPRLALSWYCWRMETFNGATCSQPRVGPVLATIVTLGMTGLIVRMCLSFGRRWRLYLKTISE